MTTPFPSPDERYFKLETKTLPDGRVVYRSAIPLTVTANSTMDTSFIASDQDRLDIIANNVYGSALSWWKIAAANKNVNGSVHIKPGTNIIIPSGN